MNGNYDPLLVALSIVVASFASYTALDLADTVALVRGRARLAWLSAGALAMGVGIWSMHFVGMLAFRMPGMPIAYDIRLVVLSAAVAILASALALSAVGRRTVTLSAMVLAALAMGAAIAGMHYIGVWSMRMPARVEWSIGLVTLSLVIAVAASFAGLWLAFRYGLDRSGRAKRIRIGGGVVIGFAIAGMHYTAMAASRFVPQASQMLLHEQDVLATDGLAIAVTATTLLILIVAVAGSVISRELARRTALAEENARLYRTAEEARRQAEELAEELQNQATHLEDQPVKLEALNDELSAAEGRLRGIVDSALDALIVTDARSVILEWNHYAETIFGWSAAEAVGKSLSETIIPPQYREAHQKGVERYLTTGEGPILNRRIEITALARDGREFPVELAVAPVRAGSQTLFTAFIRDITERKRAEAALRESESRYSALIDQAADAVFIHDDQGAILDVNREACQSLGYAREELLQMRIPDIAVPGGMALPEVFQAISRGETVATEGWNRRKDGTLLPVEVRVGPVRIGEEVQFLAIARDITERRTAEARLLESEERFRQLAENINSVFWLYDFVEQRPLYVSPAYERIWGRPRETVHEDPTAWMDAVHPEDREKVRPPSLETIQGGYATEYRVIRPDGEVRTISDRGFPVRDERGEIIRAAGIAEDITPLVEAQRKLFEREAHYRRLVTTAPEGIYALDADGHFVELNPAGEEILERSAAEVLGKHFATVVLPEDLPIAERVFTSILCGAEGKIAFELRINRPSGEHRLLQLAATGIREGDQITGLHGIARDITEERSREHTMRLLTAALESFEEGISLTTARGEVLYANTALTHILGIEPESAQELDIPSLLPDDAAREQYREIHHALATEGRWSGRVWRRRLSDGQVIPLDMIAGAVEAPDGERNLFFVVHEATEEIERENRIRRVERLASVGTLIGGVAHELNNPLHAIRNFAELMLLDERDADDRESLEIVKREADRAAKIVSDLRLIARDTQEEKSQRAAVDLNDVVHHVLKLRRYSLETGNVEIREDLARDLPPVLANRGELEQVVLNLVINAEQAMASQAGEKRLILRTRWTRKGASVHVIDSGPGIPARHLDRIWDPFYTTKEPGEGTGLGLSLVHSIVSEHGGEIEVDSEPGTGTAFRIDLPPAPAGEASDPQESTATAPARSLRILVVDDEDAIRRVTVRFLERRGHQVDTAREGGEALRLLEGTDYDVIVSDLKMPGLGGEELFDRLREQGRGKEHTLIFVTGDAASGQTARMVSEANVPMLIKPVRLDDLARAVETIQEGTSPAD